MKKAAISGIISILLFAISMAMPPKPGLYNNTGRSITTGDPYPQFPEYFGRPLAGAKLAADVVGTGKMAVVLVDFPDHPADPEAHPSSEYQDMIFSVGTYSTGSLNDFFIENSYGDFSVEGDVYGWVTTSQQYSYFDDGNYGLSYGGRRVAAAAAALTDQFVDYSEFDNDGPDGVPNSGDDDGIVDAFTVIHAGLGGEDSGDIHDIWSHASMIDFTTNDLRTGGGNIRIQYYTIQPEERLDGDGNTHITGISVICHEYGHILGLPDLYDPSRYTWGIGYWGLMGYGAWGAGGTTPESPAHLCAWSKINLGWITAVNIDDNTLNMEIPAAETSPTAYKIWRNGIPTSEYFLLENRQQTGFDTPAPGHGLLIWHYNSNRGAYFERLELEQADGLDELNDGDGNRPDPHFFHDHLGDDSDPFPGTAYNTRFGPDTDPSSDSDYGNPTDVIIGNIREIGNNIVADLVIDPEIYFPAPTSVSFQFGCESISFVWSPPESDDPIPDGYNVYRKIGQGNWEIVNDDPIGDTSYTDTDIIYDQDVTYGVKALYGDLESAMACSGPVNVFDPLAYDCVIVGDSSTEYLNNWYKMILDSLGVTSRIAADILPYCGETLAGLPTLWIVSYPGNREIFDDPDRESAVIDYLDNGGRLFLHDGWPSFTMRLYDYLLYDYSTCIVPPFIDTYGVPGTFAEGLFYSFPDSVGASYLCAMGNPPASSVLLADDYGCSSVAVVTDTAGYKAVINSQPLYEMIDGPNGTRLEFFNRMLNFFDIQTDIDDNPEPLIPDNLLTISAFPNPFNSDISLNVFSPYPAEDITVEIYDITGRLVRRFDKAFRAVIWDGKSADGRSVTSGVYFVRAASGDKSASVKLTLLK